jgi:hypothetical protein
VADPWAWLAELPGTPSTRASAGYAERAAALQTLAGAAHSYLCDALGTSFDPLVVVATPADWDEGEDGAPYGIPYASDTELVVVIPAEADGNPLVDDYARVASRADAARFADLIAVHELGHLHVRELGLELPSGWLGEFVATYLSSCFLAAHQPADAELWHRLSADHAAASTPTERSLERLDDVYFGVGPTDYVWYQDTLSNRVAPVRDAVGVDFVLGLRSAGLTPQSTTAETLAAAEALCPGFEDWAASLRG